MSETKQDASGAAIVCAHVASGKLPILYAERTEPVDDLDSGWQFLCDSGAEEQIAEAETWSVNEVIEHDPSIKGFIHRRPDIRLTRDGVASPWRVIN